MATVIAITSGKSGAGKTNVAINLGLALVARKAKVCIFDLDTGRANINILLAIKPQHTLEQVLDGKVNIADIVIKAEGGLFVVPVVSGALHNTDLTAEKRQILVAALAELEKNFDYLLIDTATGIDSGVLDFAASAQYRVVVITPESTSLIDSFALLKMLSIRGSKRNLFALVNRANDYKSSQKVFRRIQAAVDKYLNVKINYLGYLANDHALIDAVGRQVSVVIAAPESPVSCCFFALGDIVKRQFLNEKNLPYFSHYWKQIPVADNQRIAQEKIIARRLRLRPKSGSEAGVKWSEVVALLEQQGYPEVQMRDMVETLEAAFEKEHGKPLKSTERQILGLLNGVSGSEKNALLLQKALSYGFERQFHKKMDDPVVSLTEQMKDENFSRQEFSKLMMQFGQIYRERFGVGYFGDGEQLLEQISQLLNRK